MDDKDTKNNLSMISKSMNLIELLASHPAGLTLQEMVGLLNYPKSTIHKIATTLYESGYLGKELDSFKYYLSRKLLTIGLSAVSGYNIIERSKEHMRRLRDSIGESVMIGTLVDKEVILLNQLQGSLDFVFTLKQGMRFSLYSTAPGKVLFAYMSKSEQAEILDQIHLKPLNQYTIVDRNTLQSEINKIVKIGYAIDINETIEGVHCIAAPIFDEQNKAIACVWTSGPAGRLPSNNISAIAKQITKCGLAISSNIGYKKLSS